MKKILCIALALLLLTGCGAPAAGTEPAPETTQAPPETTHAPEAPQPPETTFPTLPESGFATGPVIGILEGEDIPFENPGKLRLTYEGNRCYVRYVTSVEQLPADGSWEGYDEAYFETKALLIVVETLNSGSIQVDLESVRALNGRGAVTLRRTMSGDVGTADMATWLLWAEVEKGLELDWFLTNGSLPFETDKY